MGLVKDFAITAVDLSRVMSTLVKEELQKNMTYMKSEVKSILIWTGIMVVAIFCLIFGVGFLLAGGLILLAEAVGWGLSAIIMGAVILWIAIMLMVIMKSTSR